MHTEVMHTEVMNVSDLRHPERNSRIHPEKQIAELCRALEMFGQTRPLVIDENNTVLAGNGLLDAMTKLGWGACTVYVKEGLSQDQKIKLILSDNKIYDLGVDDHDVITAMLKDITDFDVPGFDADFLKDINVSLKNLTEEHMDSFGKLPDDSKHGENIPPGRKETEIECPNCGIKFAY